MNKTQNKPYERTESGEKFASNAAYKMIIWWLDGNVRTFYSREFKNNRRVMTDIVALSKQKAYAYREKTKIDIAIIYDNQTGLELHRFKDGKWT